ncbi:MAG: O-acetylhomoserine aminocarboxypropyltransferase/cysteine synthase [Sulfurovum sp.]|nr:MAG: O-acetylhomoserine aminocarboxypropyltransferase/cysteine synthase [Sulfurovum sp.]
MHTDFEHYNTLLVHATANQTGAIGPAVIPSAAFGYESAQEAEGIFAGEVQKPLYARVGNPTNAKLEAALARMEGGFGAIATSSGMGALALVMTAILEAGDEVLCIGGFFGGTYTLVRETFARFGIQNSFCEVDDFETIEAKLQSGIKMVLFESVGNPSLTLPDIPRILTLCKRYETLSVIDNTATPLLVRPIELGADIVMHSTTKNISGFAGPLGGAVVFRAVDPQRDTLLNEKYAPLHKFVKKAGAKAFMAILKKRALRDMGMTASAMSSYITMLGLETLALRVERINRSVAEVAMRLAAKLPEEITVNHPALSQSPDHDRYLSDFPQGCGPLLTLECGTKARAFALLDRLKMVIKTANIGDNRTLALHMASTIYRDFSEEDRRYLGVTEGLIRVSIGLESPDAIVEDFLQAAQG